MASHRILPLASARAGLLSLLAAVLSFPAVAADWPQFRGPRRDGVWDEAGILEHFPPAGIQVIWERPVGGGFSSPVVADGQVFVFDVELVKPTARERLHCFDENTGESRWVFAYDEPYGEWAYVPERGAGPTATPVVDGNRVFIVGANGFVHCLDVKTGAVLWQKNVGREYRVAEMSCRPSPLIEGALLILATGARPGASVLALDKSTGKEVWKSLDDPVSNSSPLVITVAGRRELIVWSNSALTSLDPLSGQVVWRELMTTSGNESAASPVFSGSRLLVSGLMAELSTGAPRFLWPEIRSPSRRILSSTSTPVLQGQLVFAGRGHGELVCLDAGTGGQLWSTNGITLPRNGASIQLTPLASKPGGFFIFTDEGNLIRADLSASGYREISRAHLIDPTWPFDQHKYVYAPPAFAGRRVFARSESQVVCASLAAQ